MRRVVVMLLALACAATSDGCGSGSSSEDGSSSSPSAATTFPSSSPSAEGPTDTYADVEPASGETMRLDGIALDVPEDFVVDSTGGGVATASSQEVGDMSVTSDPLGSDSSLEAARRTYNDSAGRGSKRIPALDPVVVDGVRMFHQRYMDGDVVTTESFGFSEAGRSITIQFDLIGGLTTQMEQRTVVESVMASVQLDLG